MRLTSVVLTSWISSITSKISWIVGWPWSNHVCGFMCACASVSACNWFYNLIHGSQKQILVFFLSENLYFGLDKSWKNHGTFFWDFCGNPVFWWTYFCPFLWGISYISHTEQDLNQCNVCCWKAGMLQMHTCIWGLVTSYCDTELAWKIHISVMSIHPKKSSGGRKQ